jgi:hypothetical protein
MQNQTNKSASMRRHGEGCGAGMSSSSTADSNNCPRTGDTVGDVRSLGEHGKRKTCSSGSDNEGQSSKKKKKSPKQTCTICLSEVENEASPSNCTHTFCKECILEWVKRKNACPNCRRHFTSLKTKEGNISLPQTLPEPPILVLGPSAMPLAIDMEHHILYYAFSNEVDDFLL